MLYLTKEVLTSPSVDAFGGCSPVLKTTSHFQLTGEGFSLIGPIFQTLGPSEYFTKFKRFLPEMLCDRGFC